MNVFRVEALAQTGGAHHIHEQHGDLFEPLQIARHEPAALHTVMLQLRLAAGLAPTGVDDVFLTGGTSQLPFVRDLFVERQFLVGRFEFVERHDFDLHIAVEVERDDMMRMFEKGRAAGIETRGVADHGFIDSIYFRDPNGYVVELTTKKPNHAAATDPAQNQARELLDRWQARKLRPA